MRRAKKDPCEYCGHSLKRHPERGACRVGWTKLYAEGGPCGCRRYEEPAE